MDGTELRHKDLLLVKVLPLVALGLLAGGGQGDALAVHIP